MVVEATPYYLDEFPELIFYEPPSIIYPSSDYLEQHRININTINNRDIPHCERYLVEIIFELAYYIGFFNKNPDICAKHKHLFDDTLSVLEWVSNIIEDDKWTMIYFLPKIIKNIGDFLTTLRVFDLNEDKFDE